MTKAEEDTAVQPKSSTPEIDKRKDRDRPPSKIVIRRLPPSLTPENFLEQVSPLPDHDFFYFVRADMSLGQNAFCRAYVNFLNAEDVFIFRDKFDGYVFLDEKGGEYPAVVEFAPFHKVTKKRQRKVDSKCGMLEQDSDYKRFLEVLANPPETPSVSLDAIVEEVEAKESRLANMGSIKTNTPLLEYLKRRKEEKRMNMVKLRDERRRGGRDRDRDYDRRRSAKDEGGRKDRGDRDRHVDRDRRKERAREVAREKERERRRGDRDRGGGGGRQRDRRNEGGRRHDDEEKPKPIMLLKNTERESQAKDEPLQDRVKGEREGGRLGKEERGGGSGGGGGGGGDKWKKGGERDRDRRRDWDDRPLKSGRDRGGGDGRRRGEEFRDRGGRWKEDGRSRGGGGRGGGGAYREEDDYRPPRRGDKRWDEKGGGDRTEKGKDADRERGGGGAGGRDRVREDNRRSGGGGGGGGGIGRNRDRETGDKKYDGGGSSKSGASSGSGGGGGRDRDGDVDRKKPDRDRPGERRTTADGPGGSGGGGGGGSGGGGKNSNSNNNSSSSSQRKSTRGSAPAGSVKDSRDDKRKDEEIKTSPDSNAARVKSEKSAPDNPSTSTGGHSNNRSEEGGGEEKGGNSSETGGDGRRKRKERPERQIYIPRRALEKQRQNSPQPGDGDSAKGGKTG